MGNTLSASTPYDSQSLLAEKLAQNRPIVLAFLSPSCGLCKSLEPQLAQAEKQVLVAKINSSDTASWVPELLAYNVEAVPCFVLLNRDGCALGKSTPPRTTHQMSQALDALLSIAQFNRKEEEK